MTLTADSILKQYNNKPLLTDIYLRCDLGQTLGLLGRNGSGKSTLLKIIAGIEASDQKMVRIDQTRILRAGQQQMLSYLPQDTFMPPHLKVSTLIDLYCPTNAKAQLHDHEVIRQRNDQKFGLLSTGERRLIEVLLTLHQKANFILLDEPFRGLAPVVQQLILEIIEEQSGNKGIIITDHNYELLMKSCDHILLLKGGALHPIHSYTELQERGYLVHIPGHTP